MHPLAVLVLIVAGAGCDKLFSLTHVDRDADIDAPPCSPRAVATGKHHTCEVDYQGRVYCWGRNDLGEAVPAGPKHVLDPTRVVLPLPAVQITAGKLFTCARLEDGAVWCWGDSSFGQLGTGVTDASPGPVAIPGIAPSAEVRAGGVTACSRSAVDGAVWCWGSNKFRTAGQTTDVICPSKEGCVTPSLVPTTEGSKALAMGHRHACVIGADDRVRCWGRDKESQLGDSAAAGAQRTLPMDIPQLATVAAVSTAGRHTCVLDFSGAMLCWGEGYEGQLATGATEAAGTPTSTAIVDARLLALGNNGGCAVLGDGSVSCWGAFDGGDGGAGVEVTPVTAQIDGVSELASGQTHTCAIARGEIYCWGLDADGQLGRGSRAFSDVPVEIFASGATFVAAGDDNGCANTSDGISCWGGNDYGQTGVEGLQWQYTPHLVTAFGGVEGLVSGYDRTCAWGGGQAKCWGRGNTFTLGNQQTERSFATPQTVAASNVAQVALGGDHTCVRQVGGTIVCFGFNGKGQLGTSPMALANSKTGYSPSLPAPAARVTAGRVHTCALTTTPAIYCWGTNDYGQVGDGSTDPKYMPTQVTGTGTAVDVQAGGYSTCARDMTGAIWCWGLNNNGQIGDGTRTGRSSPVKLTLPGAHTATDLAVGVSHACAILDDQSVACWGDGDDGQLGNGTSDDSLVPVIIPAFFGATRLDLGESGTCALFPGGKVTCTGDMRYLARGDASRSVPQLTTRGACDN